MGAIGDYIHLTWWGYRGTGFSKKYHGLGLSDPHAAGLAYAVGAGHRRIEALRR